MKFEVGKRCKFLGWADDPNDKSWPVGRVYVYNGRYLEHEDGGMIFPSSEHLFELLNEETKELNEPTGGPQGYYDWNSGWKTLNDFIEYKSKEQWHEHSFHLGNIVKAATRWGIKKGTTVSYDAHKIIYSGCRILMSVIGKDELRKYLNDLLEDEQFK